MMENLELCRYFKGEQKNPFIGDESKCMFWELEKQYFYSDDFDHTQFESIAKEYIESHPNDKTIISENIPLEQKGFIMFADYMIEKWSPSDRNIIFDYGK